MDNRWKLRFRFGVPARFKLIRFLLLLVVISFFLNIFISLQIFRNQEDYVLTNMAPYIIFQVNYAAIILVFVVSLVWILHYGFGALSRMENILEQVVNGDHTFRMHLRKRDIMRPFAEKMNRVLDLLEEANKNKR